MKTPITIIKKYKNILTLCVAVLIVFVGMQFEMKKAGEKDVEASYSIGHSLRFRSDNSSYMSRTPGATGSTTKWTMSLWVKPSKFGAVTQHLFNAYSNPSNYCWVSFSSNGWYSTDDTLIFASASGGQVHLLKTTAVFRDPSAWYHLNFVVDTAQAIDTDRVSIYINGEKVTSFASPTYPTQGAAIPYMNTSGIEHRIGYLYNGGFDGYMSDIHFVDGQALSPTSFGETSTTTGSWVPKAYSGTYGSNGFHLDFTDGTSTTTLGYDSAGSNDWTLTGFSASSTLTSYDWMTDTPTKNFATLNPLHENGMTLGNANLTATSTVNNISSRGSIAMRTGKFVWESTRGDTDSDSTKSWFTGIVRVDQASNATFYNTLDSYLYYSWNGNKYASGTASAGGASWLTVGDVIRCEFDADAHTLAFYKNGTHQFTISNISDGEYVPVISRTGGTGATSMSVNFGQQPFVGTPSSGYNKLSTDNLPEPTILKPSDHFDAVAYTGNGSYLMPLGSLYSNPTPSYDVAHSLRFKRSAPSYLQRTFGTPTDGKKWTWSGWVKRSELFATNNYQFLFVTEGSGAQGFIGFGLANNADELSFGYGGFYRRYTVAQFRDPTAWQHIVLSVDTATTSEADRAIFYINGVKANMVTPTTITQNDTTQLNQAVSTLIGNQTGQAYGRFDGYLSGVHFIDGQALGPTYFGEVDATTGAWVPKAYAGSYGYDYTRWITPTTTGNIWTGAAYMTVDEDTSTNFGWNYSRNVATGSVAQWDIDLGTARSISKWRIYNNDSTYSLPSWKLQYSPNGSSYTDVTTLTTAAGAWSEYSFTAVEARYWRILPGSNGGDANAFGFREVELIDTSASYYGNNGFYLPFATTTSTTTYSMYFDGGDDHVAVADNAAVDLGTGAFTAEAWFQFNDTTNNAIFGRYDIGSGSYGMLQVQGSNVRWYYANGTSYTFAITTPTVGRWYHYAISRDGSSNLRFFIDGVQQGATQTDTTNYDGTGDYRIGRAYNGANGITGSISNFRLVKGSALYTSNFVATRTPLTNISGTSILTLQNSTLLDNSSNGFSMTTNSFPVVQFSSPFDGNFFDDTSGNNFDWRGVNIGTTSSSTSYDIMEDTPTDNYATMNPLMNNQRGSMALYDGNLRWTNTAGAVSGGCPATFNINGVGKIYFEAMPTTMGSETTIGIAEKNTNWATGATGWSSANLYSYLYDGRYANNASTSSGHGTYTTTSVIMVAYDPVTGKIWFGRDGTWNDSGDPTNGTNQAFIIADPSTDKTPFVLGYQGAVWVLNFGQQPFKYTPPTGFNALKSTNLTAPTTFDPGLVWIKNRTTASTNHGLYDVTRGSTLSLVSNSTAAEASVAGGLLGFNKGGFSVGNDSTVNTSGSNYIAWNWKAGGVPVTNIVGSVTSTVSANPTAGFSIVKWVGTGANATVGHGLDSPPKMLFVKNSSSGVYNWHSWHTGLTSGAYFFKLSGTDAQGSDGTVWNSTSPTTTVFSIGSYAGANGSGDNMTAYAWSEVPGYSKFGSYIGNGSTDGPFVYTGFKPRYVVTKRIDTTGSWWTYDTERSPYNVVANSLYLESSGAESSATNELDIVSNGFKLRWSSSNNNASGGTYIYAAFAELPFKYSTAGATTVTDAQIWFGMDF